VAAYTVDARPRVRKALRQLDSTVRKDVLAKMRALAADPRPPGTEPLRGYSPWLRVRVGVTASSTSWTMRLGSSQLELWAIGARYTAT
jgi:hypothetical protein